MSKEVTKKSMEEYLKELNKSYGAGTIVHGKGSIDYEVINTGSLALNKALGTDGYAVGKLIELLGPESSGKSTIALHAIKEFQQANKKVVLCDAEHSFDSSYASAIGVNVDDLYFTQPSCMEDAYNIIETMIKAGAGLVVIDSHTALMPKVIVEGKVGEQTIGMQARLNSVALGKIKPLLDTYGCTLIAISQLRQAIGGMGETNISTGGLGYKFYSDIRLKVWKSADKDNETNKTTVDVVKNKLAKPFGKATFKVNWGTGIDYMQEIIDFGVDMEIINKGGAWYTLPNESKFQGSEKLKEFFIDNPEYFADIESTIKAHLNGTDKVQPNTATS